MIAPSQNADNPQIKAALVEAIGQAPDGRITFERFMEIVLYQPGAGYYTHRAGLIGARGDFYTAPHLTPVFGELVARQVAEFWERLGRPAHFEIVEMGAGQGLLASDILTILYRTEPTLWAGLVYTIIEVSEPLRRSQQRRLEAVPDGRELSQRVRWADLNDLAPDSVQGCFVSNELLDAFPVHGVIIQGGHLQEIYVRYDETTDRFEEEFGPLSNPALAHYFERLGLKLTEYQDGYRTEVNLRMLDWLWQVARSLGQGFILTIDYGYPAAQRYHPLRRDGSLQCYASHQVHDDPYINLGRQDITSHVDFTTLIEGGESLGLHKEGFTKQANFLAALGIGERLVALADPAYRVQAGLTTKQQLAEYEALQRLINPTVLGNFGVLIQSRHVPTLTQPLTGLSMNF